MIAIPNMEKPSDCIYCRMYNDEWYDEELGIEFYCILKDDQADACPLIDIVTCGECRWFVDDGFGFGHCERLFVGHLSTAEYGFCSEGERRADGHI